MCEHMCEKVALEIVFPRAAEFRLPDEEIEHNDGIVNGIIYNGLFDERHVNMVRLFAGSKAEGLALEWFWGQKRCDKDVMLVYSGAWTVYPDVEEDSDTTPPRLVLESTSSPAFHKIRAVGDLDKLSKMMGAAWVRCVRSKDSECVGSTRARSCFSKKDGKVWLHSDRVFDILRPPDTQSNGSGPAANAFDKQWDVVPALIYPGRTREMKSYLDRIKDKTWPTEAQQHDLSQFPLFLVCKGQWRESWSLHELYLLSR